MSDPALAAIRAELQGLRADLRREGAVLREVATDVEKRRARTLLRKSFAIEARREYRPQPSMARTGPRKRRAF